MELKVQIGESGSSVNTMDSAMLTISHHKSIKVEGKVLLKENFKEFPSQAFLIDLPFSLTSIYRGQNWIAKLELPNHLSSQNLILLPSPTFQAYPIWAACLAQSTPFQNGEAPLSGQQNRLGELFLYL